MNTQTMKKLINEAKKARRGSHSPYSKYAVGAAILAANDKIYTGANVENASFGLTICAERAAALKAVNDGAKKFKAAAVVADGALPSPCGACRQVLAEFSPGLEMMVIFSNLKGKFEVRKLKELLPDAFVFES